MKGGERVKLRTARVAAGAGLRHCGWPPGHGTRRLRLPAALCRQGRAHPCFLCQAAWLIGAPAAQGNVIVVGRKSPFSLYDEKIASFEDDGGLYDQKDAEGFIKLQARLGPCARRPVRCSAQPRCCSVLSTACLCVGLRRFRACTECGALLCSHLAQA